VRLDWSAADHRELPEPFAGSWLAVLSDSRCPAAWLERRETELAKPDALERDKTPDPTLASVIDCYAEESVKDIGRTKTQVLRAIKSYEYQLDQNAMRDAFAVAKRPALRPKAARDRRPTMDELDKLMMHFGERLKQLHAARRALPLSKHVERSPRKVLGRLHHVYRAAA